MRDLTQPLFLIHAAGASSQDFHRVNFHGIYPDDSLTRVERKALLAYLNSPFLDDLVSQHERTYADGLDKLEPGDLEDLPVIDLRDLSHDVVQSLAATFDALRETVRHDEGTDEKTIHNHIEAILNGAL